MLGPMRWGPGGGRSRVSWAVLDWMRFRGFESIFYPSMQAKADVKENPISL